jgi:hypothetical protein
LARPNHWQIAFVKIIFRVVLLAVFAALAFWLWTILFPNPEKIIRRRLEEVAKHASFTADESSLTRLAGAQSLAGYFSTNAEINLNSLEEGQYDFIGRDQITQAALAAGSVLGSLSVKFLDVSVSLAPNKQSATADLTVDANVSGQPNTIVNEVKITLRKISGQWFITRVETIRTLSILDFELPRAPSIVLA